MHTATNEAPIASHYATILFSSTLLFYVAPLFVRSDGLDGILKS